MSARALWFGAAVVMLAMPAPSRAQSADSTAALPAAAARADSSSQRDRITYLVPGLEGAGFRVSNDSGRFMHRVSFSPAYGRLGENELFSFRIGYAPNTWLGYEVALGHNPADGLHALLHTFNVIVRKPLPGRFQPYATLGYGMLTVYPGQALNADPVTKNALAFGGGLEVYLRNDVALRGELRGATVLGQELHTSGTVAYDYREYTIGFAFYRNLGS